MVGAVNIGLGVRHQAEDARRFRCARVRHPFGAQHQRAQRGASAHVQGERVRAAEKDLDEGLFNYLTALVRGQGPYKPTTTGSSPATSIERPRLAVVVLMGFEPTRIAPRPSQDRMSARFHHSRIVRCLISQAESTPENSEVARHF